MPNEPRASSWMPSSGLRPPPTRRIRFGGERFGSCVRGASSNALMPRDGKSLCPPLRRGNAAAARPTAPRSLPPSTGTFSAHTGLDWTTLLGVGGAAGGRPSARGQCPRRLPRRLRPGLLPALQAWHPLGSDWRNRTSGPTLEWRPCIPGSSARGSGMGRLYTSRRSSGPARPMPEVLSLCMAERAADGHSASGLRGPASAVRAAEDLALVPRVVAALHWRIAKSGIGPSPQAYVSPRALVHIWNAATAPDDRAVAALAALSWTMWLRVGEAASIRGMQRSRAWCGTPPILGVVNMVGTRNFTCYMGAL